MHTIKETRKYQYDYHAEKFPFLNNWKRNPYTFLKSRFYMEMSAILVFFLLKTRIKPNTITVLYALSGIVGGILLAVALKTTCIIALIIFFTKGILDWSDGHLARITGQTSVTGHVLDVYGAFLNDLSLQTGLGFYVAAKTGNDLFYYLIPLIPFFYAAKLTTFSEIVIYEELSKKGFVESLKHKPLDDSNTHKTLENVKTGSLGKYRKCYELFSMFLDARARSVDFICLLILIELFTNISVTWIIFIAFILKGAISLLGGYLIILRKGLIEKTLDTIIYNIRNSFEEDK